MSDIDKEYVEQQVAKINNEEEDHVGDLINLIMNPSVSQEVAEGDMSRATTPINDHPYARMDDEQKDFY